MARPIGCCTWIFGGEDLSATALRVRHTGLDGVEIHGDLALDAVLAGRIFADQGLAIYSITPADADISHPDAAIRAAGVDYYLRLADWAEATGHAPRIGCHGLVGRIRAVTTQQAEDDLLATSVAQICAATDQTVVFEILNRYESHQVRTVAEGLALLARIGAANLRLLPDAYHMNIEETDPAAALAAAGAAVGLYHLADSNRGAVGDGHTDFSYQFRSLDAIGYDGPMILEPAAPGPDPFNTDKGPGFRDTLGAMLARSVAATRALGG